MAVAPINTIILYGEISQYLAANSISTNNLFRGGDLMPKLSRLLYIVRKQVQNRYNINPADSTLDATANYLYALCGRFINQAKIVLGSGGTGTIINPATGTISTIVAQNIEFIVDGSSPILDGQTTFTLNYNFVLNSSVTISLDGIDLPIAASDRISFTVIYNNNNIVITFNQAAITGQLYSVRFLEYVTL